MILVKYSLFLLALVLLALVPLSVSAGQLTAQFENDLWGSGSDQHYTHGSRFSWSSENQLGWVQKSARRVGGLLPWLPALDEKTLNQFEAVRFNAAIGQNIYTPEDISDPLLISDDRPYAGWLYIGSGAVLVRGAVNHRVIDSFEVNLGIVGPSSRAKQVQREFHKLIDSPDPRGWDNQLRDEPGLVVMADRQWVFPLGDVDKGLEWDLAPHLSGALGNVFTHLAAGATLRTGRNLEMDFGPPTIRPSKPGSNFFSRQNGQWGWYLFAGVEARAVGRNIFLDGNTFKSSHKVDRETWVVDGQVGAVLMVSRLRIAFTNVFRSKEFVGQQTPSEFGAISITLDY